MTTDMDTFCPDLASRLALSLLRCILTEGTVYYDGIPTASLNLDDLRSKITIIPQAVCLFLTFL
jgi:ABC-type multidrug transport system fused ATPase/permease subunit